MLKKEIYISFIIACIISLAVNAQFEMQNSGTNKNLFQIFFTENNTGYIIGEEGTLLKTINGGKKWIELAIDNQNDLAGIYFHNPDTGFIIGEHNTFLRTLDGGENWEDIDIPVMVDLSSIKFINKTTGYVTGHGSVGGIILKTTDAGLTWNCKIITDNCFNTNQITGIECEDINLLTMSFINESEGIIGGFSYNYKIGKRAFLCKTTDGGDTFTDISPDLGVNGRRNGWRDHFS